MHLKRPTREQCGPHLTFPYLALLRTGFTLPWLLPATRCALTAPFHPYLPEQAVYFLWHFPSAHAAQVLPGALPCGARTFLPFRGDCLADSATSKCQSGEVCKDLSLPKAPLIPLYLQSQSIHFILPQSGYPGGNPGRIFYWQLCNENLH